MTVSHVIYKHWLKNAYLELERQLLDRDILGDC